jgi:hypothetical protein
LIERVHRVQQHGIDVWCGMIVGFDHDDPSIFEAIPKFLAEARVSSALVGLLYAIQTTPLYDRLRAAGRLTFFFTLPAGRSSLGKQLMIGCRRRATPDNEEPRLTNPPNIMLGQSSRLTWSVGLPAECGLTLRVSLGAVATECWSEHLHCSFMPCASFFLSRRSRASTSTELPRAPSSIRSSRCPSGALTHELLKKAQ